MCVCVRNSFIDFEWISVYYGWLGLTKEWLGPVQLGVARNLEMSVLTIHVAIFLRIEWQTPNILMVNYYHKRNIVFSLVIMKSKLFNNLRTLYSLASAHPPALFSVTTTTSPQTPPSTHIYQEALLRIYIILIHKKTLLYNFNLPFW